MAGSDAGAAGGGGGNSRELDQTPTWAVASVCVVIILVSLLLDMGLHRIGQWFTKGHKKALFQALEKIKSELMIVGFISLLLNFGQNYIAKICIPQNATYHMLPCSTSPSVAAGGEQTTQHRLLWDEIVYLNPKRRILAADSGGSSCPKGKVELVSTHGLHQLHIFIFFLAVFHVLYSAITMALGQAKIRRWKEWEKETLSLDYEFSNDPSRFRFAHETSFVKRHTSFWNRITILLYIVSFFRQFFWSVRKADYLTLRHGFITVHLAPGSKFDFHKYIKRSLEIDFKVVVGISPVLWASAVIFLLLNVNGWQIFFWMSILPLVILLAVGTKLQAIITKMAVVIQDTHAVVQGIPIVNLSEDHFWFSRPRFVLFLIHFTLFQNALQIIYFLWIWYEFGLRSCFHENFKLIITRMCVGVGVQFLCSYITLPLYALVSQMGSEMKKSIFDEQTSKTLMKWHQAARKRHAKGRTPARSPSVSPLGLSPLGSPAHPLHRYRSRTNWRRSAATSRMSYYSDRDMPDTEFDMPSSWTANVIPAGERNSVESESPKQHLDVEETGNGQEDFSSPEQHLDVEETGNCQEEFSSPEQHLDVEETGNGQEDFSFAESSVQTEKSSQ